MKNSAFLWILSLSLWVCTLGKDVVGQETYKIKESRPAYGDLALEMDDETIIHESNENSDYRFSFIKDLAVDRTGNFLVLDKDRILKYDSRGNFIRSIGRKGQGPGEYQNPQSLFVDEHNDLFVNDQGWLLHVFNGDGEFKHRIKLNFQIPFDSDAFYVDGEGHIYAFSWDMMNMEMKKTLVKADENGEVLSRMKMMDENAVKVSGLKTGGVMGGMIHQYSSNSFFCPVSNSLLCFGENIRYQLIFYDFNGNMKSVVDRDEKTQSISSEEKNILGKNGVFPSHRPFFNKLLSDDKGRIYVIRVKSVLEKSKAEKADIFGKSGRYLYRTEFPFMPMAIKSEAVYFIDEDQEGMRMIIRTTIRNYNRIREE